jgi:hypothetical protein
MTTPARAVAAALVPVLYIVLGSFLVFGPNKGGEAAAPGAMLLGFGALGEFAVCAYLIWERLHPCDGQE